jgi:required for meiotic nuclear division protein 1
MDTMRTIRFRSCKIGPNLPLEKTAAFFRLKRSSGWKEYIELQGPHLEEILKRHCGPMKAYLFEFGCITFVDFEDPDITLFLEFIEGIVDGVDYAMVARFSENHLLMVDDDGSFRPWPESEAVEGFEESYIPLFALLLAKSAALNKIEYDVNANIDDSETYLDYLRRGQLRMNKKALMMFVSKFLKFEYESIHSVRIFDRSVAENVHLNGRKLYDSFAEYMEIWDRFDVLQSKIASLRNTMKTYNSLSHRQIENRLYLFEVFLLGLFPVMYLVRWFFHL